MLSLLHLFPYIRQTKVGVLLYSLVMLSQGYPRSLKRAYFSEIDNEWMPDKTGSL